MPEISRFYGIIIRMCFNDHNPPHFHAYYGEQQAQIDIDTLTVIGGHLPPRALSMIVEWAGEHRYELLEDWTLARSHAPLNRIDPLP